MIQAAATKTISRFAVYVFLACCFFLINYVVKRTDFVFLAVCYVLLFATFAHILFYWKNEKHIYEAAVVSIFLRMLLLFSTPNLSEDYLRFAFDGTLITEGINPYKYLPLEVMMNHFSFTDASENKDITSVLASNSSAYFSVYPPLLQLLFAISAFISNGNTFLLIIFLKLIILFAETGTIYFLRKILLQYKLPVKNLLLYALNPLIIIEFSGNIHFEAVMIFFLAAWLYFSSTNKYVYSILFFSLAVCTKLWPLLLLPLFFRRYGLKQSIFYSFSAFMLLMLSFLPFYFNGVFQNYEQSLLLYFNSFEFNASIYYFLKYCSGNSYEMKLFLQHWLPYFSLIGIILLSIFYKKKNFIFTCLLAFMFYFFCSTTVHPWYISILIFFAAITSSSFPVIWSFFICFTYIAYQTEVVKENYWIIAAEYVFVIAALFVEIYKRGIKNKQLQKQISFSDT